MWEEYEPGRVYEQERRYGRAERRKEGHRNGRKNAKRFPVSAPKITETVTMRWPVEYRMNCPMMRRSL